MRMNMLNILLIDDEPELLEITYEQITLNFNNVNIAKSFSGNEGISLLMKGEKFDLIISDYIMPNGNGVDLLKYKDSFGYPGYFILYTSHISPELPNNTNQLFLGVIEKFKFDELFECISKSIKASQRNATQV